MFIMPAAPNGCHIVFIVDSCAILELNSAAQWVVNIGLGFTVGMCVDMA